MSLIPNKTIIEENIIIGYINIMC